MGIKITNDAVDDFDPKQHLLAILTGVFILVAALGWNSFGRQLIEEYYPRNLVLASLIYAIILTVVVILILYGIVSWINSSPSSSQITIQEIEDNADPVQVVNLDKKSKNRNRFILDGIDNTI